MAGGALDYISGFKKARRDLLLGLRQAALEHYESKRSDDSDTLSELNIVDLTKLRSSSILFIAEFFFVIKGLDITNDPTSLEAYLQAHNHDILTKIKILEETKSGATPSGLTITRLKEGVFKPDKIEQIVADAREGFFRFDQSTLGALLIELMVKQSTNTTLDVLGRTGFLTIIGKKPKYITSKGRLEDLYENFLNQMAEVFQNE